VPIQYGVKIFSELIKMLIERLNLKLGYNFDFIVGEFKGMERSELSSWAENTIHMFEMELDMRRTKIEYNLIYLAKKHIEENYKEELSLTEIAALTGFAPTYFSCIFKKVTGKSFIHYKTDLRIEKAKEYLISSDKPITEIAFDIGYNNVSHFIKLFKKITSVTPSEFKVKGERHK
jgi:two-component system response regulator YesN